ncbi:MAG: hypothetical protein CL920_32410 [Deltaproteobacteria bacterium]|nr:hypothetical protein [Deltaproteobacteria bacterium]MBU53423.1 hypothetical protein [Deltaproteobacteria bacterium]|tara:strand:+ start:3860 stop:6091 length:2232 start_codon:yes stop_codon:yes gene_type:complete
MPWYKFAQITNRLLCVLDANWVVVEANKTWETSLGHSLDTVKKRHFLELVHPDDRVKTSNAIARVLTSGEDITLVQRMLHVDGTYLWIEWSFLVNDGAIYASGTNVTERQDNELAFKQEQDLFEMLDTQLGLGRWRYDILTGRRYWTQTVTELYQREPDLDTDATEDGLEFYHPDDREMIAEKMRIAVAEGTPFEFQARIPQEDGPPRWVESRGLVTKSKDGEPLVVHGVLQEIARTRQHRWQASERIKFMTLFEESPDAYVVFDLGDESFNNCNAAAEVLLGCTKEQLIGLSPTDISPEFQPDGQRSDVKGPPLFQECVEKGSKRFEWTHKRFDGSNIVLEVTAALMSLDGQESILCCWRDITKLKQLEAQLKRERAKFRALFYESPDAYVVLDLTEGRFVDCNPATELLLVGKKEQLIGMTIADISPEYQPDGTKSSIGALRWLSAALDTLDERNAEDGPSNRFDWLCSRFDGQAILLEMATAVMRVDGQPLLLACWRDVTSIRKQARQLQRANTELEQFAYRTSHDLKAPLVTIKNLSTFIEEDVKSGELVEAQKNAAFVGKQASKLLGLVVDILALARSEIAVQEKSAFDLKELVDEVCASLQSFIINKKVDVRCELPAGSTLYSQRPRIRLILTNLISNGIKYSDPQKETRFVSIQYCVDEDVHLIVSDNGLGVAETDQERIFDAFTRFHPVAAEGSGLGLSIVQKNVDALGGTITYNKLDSGSQFHIIIPNAGGHSS